ncbi:MULTISPECIES: hypothetical protein [Bacillus]|uniref:hypothetical protein n=1 Tax=Bacillus TaxID=1386 RepID=UPI0003873B54|nr:MULTISPECIES: hypothetical protein [Bacillus]MBU8885901.1 hypothetical protein [Bacillus sp. FJAT-27001]CDG30102.1 conserved protein of unknown function [Bacillus velezensis UCMB5033]
MKTVIQDTADVYFRRKSDGQLVFTAEAQTASFSQTISEEKLRGGIGNKPLYILKSEKEINLTVKNAYFDLEWLAMTQGETIEEEAKVQVFDREHGLIVDDKNAVTLKGKPVSDVTFFNKRGVTYKTPVSTDGSYLIPTGFAGTKEKLTAVYQINKIGRRLPIKASKFSERYEVEYRTIAYNPDTEEVYSDIYIQFPNVSPSGEFEMSLENGNALAPEIKFEALADTDTDEMAVVIEASREINFVKDPDPGSDTETQTKSVDVGN